VEKKLSAFTWFRSFFCPSLADYFITFGESLWWLASTQSAQSGLSLSVSVQGLFGWTFGVKFTFILTFFKRIKLNDCPPAGRFVVVVVVGEYEPLYLSHTNIPQYTFCFLQVGQV
jgi:hypothetical protein